MKRIDLFGQKYGKKLNKFQLFITWIINSLYIGLVLSIISIVLLFWLYFTYKFITFYI